MILWVMAKPRRDKQLHPLGEPQNAITQQSRASQAVDTYGGKVHLRWDSDAAVTAYGQMHLADVSGMRAAHLDGHAGGLMNVTAKEMPRGLLLDKLPYRAAAGVDVASNLIQQRVRRRSVANHHQW